MLKLFIVFLIAARAMEENQNQQEQQDQNLSVNLLMGNQQNEAEQGEQNEPSGIFGTGHSETCLCCYDEFEKSVANQRMIAVRHDQPNLLCTHYLYCGDCYMENKDRIHLTLKKQLYSSRCSCCPKDRQSGELIVPEQNEDMNLLNLALNQKNQKYDSLTQHLIINSSILVMTMTVWIALEQDSKLIHTWAKLGYVLQQLVRTYYGYVAFAGWVYSFFDRPSNDGLFKWKNAEYPWRLKPSYIALYLFTITSGVLMCYRQALHANGEAGEMSSNVALWTNLASWFSMIGGLLIAIYSQIFQKISNFQHKRFANFQLSQPQEKLCGSPVKTQTFEGYLIGVLFTVVPFFSLFQGITILHRLQVSPEMYGPKTSFWHKKFIFGCGPEIDTWCGGVGIVYGVIFVLIGQLVARHTESIGVFTLDNLMLIGASFFLSFHADPIAGIILLLIEVIITLIVIAAVIRGG